MLPVYLALYEQIERRQQLQLTREESRFLRDRSDPFSLTNERFINLFRLNKDLVGFLFQELQPLMNDAIRSSRIHFQQRILVALRFFAVGSYQRAVGQEYLISVSQPVVSRSVKEVSALIVQHFGDWIKFPDENGKTLNKRQFFEYCGMPGVIGAIDCTHVRIISPPNEEHAYVNRKGYHSINVQLICDLDLRILNVNARFPGSCHDSLIWRQSAAKTHLQNKYDNGERNTWLLGDSGYPLEPWLMTPFQGALHNTPEDRYNQAHCRGRNCIERTNGVLKGRFRCILGERELRYTPEQTAVIISSCCILHNMCIRARIPFNEPLELQIDHDEVDELAPQVEEGRLLRDTLINRYFNV